jgi:cyclopropane fatty-acyl-phospholipid synthase-like methyltransferase
MAWLTLFREDNMKSDIIYTNTMVRFYDLMYERILDRSNKEFYLKEINKTKGPVLEIGTGTGRIFLPALESGADIHGIDISENMQNYLKNKLDLNEHSRLIFADIRNFELNRKFNLIIAPFRMFSHVLTMDDQLSALKCVKEHLADNGRFIFDVFLPNLELINKGISNTLVCDVEYEPGKFAKRYDSSKPDYINQQQHVIFKYEWDDAGGKSSEIIEFSFRYFFRYELEHLIARSGLKLDKMYGDFEYNEFGSESKNMVCVCKKSV